MGTLMIDTTHRNVCNIPAGTPKVAGYVTGTPDIEWTPQDWERFPRAGTVRIDQSPNLAAYGSNAGSVADIEAAAGTVCAFVNASKSRLRLGRLLWCYCSQSALGEVSAALKAAGIPLDKCGVWLANWNLSQDEANAALGTVIEGIRVVAVQWASPSSNPATQVPGSRLTMGEAQVDLSVTIPAWFAHQQKAGSGEGSAAAHALENVQA